MRIRLYRYKETGCRHHPDTPASFDEQVTTLMKRCSSKYSWSQWAWARACPRPKREALASTHTEHLHKRHEDIYSEQTKLHTWVDRYNLLLIACLLFSLQFDSFNVYIIFVTINNAQIKISALKPYYINVDNMQNVYSVYNKNSFNAIE